MMRTLITILLLSSTNLVFGASASMRTTWLIDKDRSRQSDVDALTDMPGSGRLYDSLGKGDSTRYYMLALTTTTGAESTIVENAAAAGKIHRLVDQTTIRNSLGEIVPDRAYYGRPAGHRDYTVRQSTP